MSQASTLKKTYILQEEGTSLNLLQTHQEEIESSLKLLKTPLVAISKFSAQHSWDILQEENSLIIKLD